MASDEEKCTKYPDFAVICSFIENFSEKLKISLPNIEELQILLEDTDNVNPHLAKSICLLLRRINKSVKFERWERGLQRFAHSYSHQDGWELERFGFKKSKLEVKIRVIKNLLEAQFDLYKSFKEKVNTLGAKELRLQPCGRDRNGISYWCQMDECANIRIYKDDQDEETWTLVAQSREEVEALIVELQEGSLKSNSQQLSGEESQSESNTPVVLSEAPTPISSKAPSPLSNEVNVPIQDTGQMETEEKPAEKTDKNSSSPKETQSDSKLSIVHKDAESTKVLSSDVLKEKLSPENKRRKISDDSFNIHLSSQENSSTEISSEENEREVTQNKVAGESNKDKDSNVDIPSDLSSVKKEVNVSDVKLSPEIKKKPKSDPVLDMTLAKDSSESTIKVPKENQSRKEKDIPESDAKNRSDSRRIIDSHCRNSASSTTATTKITEDRPSVRVPKEPDKDEANKRKLETAGESTAKRSKLDSSETISHNESINKQVSSSDAKVKLAPKVPSNNSNVKVHDTSNNLSKSGDKEKPVLKVSPAKESKASIGKSESVISDTNKSIDKKSTGSSDAKVVSNSLIESHLSSDNKNVAVSVNKSSIEYNSSLTSTILKDENQKLNEKDDKLKVTSKDSPAITKPTMASQDVSKVSISSESTKTMSKSGAVAEIKPVNEKNYKIVNKSGIHEPSALKKEVNEPANKIPESSKSSSSHEKKTEILMPVSQGDEKLKSLRTQTDSDTVIAKGNEKVGNFKSESSKSIVHLDKTMVLKPSEQSLTYKKEVLKPSEQSLADKKEVLKPSEQSLVHKKEILKPSEQSSDKKNICGTDNEKSDTHKPIKLDRKSEIGGSNSFPSNKAAQAVSKPDNILSGKISETSEKKSSCGKETPKDKGEYVSQIEKKVESLTPNVSQEKKSEMLKSSTPSDKSLEQYSNTPAEKIVELSKLNSPGEKKSEVSKLVTAVKKESETSKSGPPVNKPEASKLSSPVKKIADSPASSIEKKSEAFKSSSNTENKPETLKLTASVDKVESLKSSSSLEKKTEPHKSSSLERNPDASKSSAEKISRISNSSLSTEKIPVAINLTKQLDKSEPPKLSSLEKKPDGSKSSMSAEQKLENLKLTTPGDKTEPTKSSFSEKKTEPPKLSSTEKKPEFFKASAPDTLKLTMPGGKTEPSKSCSSLEKKTELKLPSLEKKQEASNSSTAVEKKSETLKLCTPGNKTELCKSTPLLEKKTEPPKSSSEKKPETPKSSTPVVKKPDTLPGDKTEPPKSTTVLEKKTEPPKSSSEKKPETPKSSTPVVKKPDILHGDKTEPSKSTTILEKKTEPPKSSSEKKPETPKSSTPVVKKPDTLPGDKTEPSKSTTILEKKTESPKSSSEKKPETPKSSTPAVKTLDSLSGDKNEPSKSTSLLEKKTEPPKSSSPEISKSSTLTEKKPDSLKLTKPADKTESFKSSSSVEKKTEPPKSSSLEEKPEASKSSASADNEPDNLRLTKPSDKTEASLLERKTEPPKSSSTGTKPEVSKPNTPVEKKTDTLKLSTPGNKTEPSKSTPLLEKKTELPKSSSEERKPEASKSSTPTKMEPLVSKSNVPTEKEAEHPKSITQTDKMSDVSKSSISLKKKTEVTLNTQVENKVSADLSTSTDKRAEVLEANTSAEVKQGTTKTPEKLPESLKLPEKKMETCESNKSKTLESTQSMEKKSDLNIKFSAETKPKTSVSTTPIKKNEEILNSSTETQKVDSTKSNKSEDSKCKLPYTTSESTKESIKITDSTSNALELGISNSYSQVIGNQTVQKSLEFVSNDKKTSTPSSFKSTSFNISGLLGNEIEKPKIIPDRESVITNLNKVDGEKTSILTDKVASTVFACKTSGSINTSKLDSTTNVDAKSLTSTQSTTNSSQKLKIISSNDDFNGAAKINVLPENEKTMNASSDSITQKEVSTTLDLSKEKMTANSNTDNSNTVTSISDLTKSSDVSNLGSTAKLSEQKVVGEAIQEPVMVIKGNGEGKLCDSLNPYINENDSNSDLILNNKFNSECYQCRLTNCTCQKTTEFIPWWEDFHSSREIISNDVDEVITEDVQYFCGNGEGALCDAGNSDDEDNSVRRSRTRSSRRNVKSVNGLQDSSPSKNDLKVKEKVGGTNGNLNGKVEDAVKVTTKDKSIGEKSPQKSTKGTLSDNSSNEKSTMDTSTEDKGKSVEDCSNNQASNNQLNEDSSFRSARKVRGRPKKGTWRKTSVDTPSDTPRSEKPQNHVENEVPMDISTSIPDSGRRQRSARIAKIREKEEHERRELEAERLKEMAEENKVKKIKESARIERRYLREIKKAKKEKKEKKKKKKRKKKIKKTQSSAPWAHSSSSSSSSSEEDESEIEEEELVFKSDHEFSPESDVEDEATPIKRARTARKVDGEVFQVVALPVKDEDDAACTKCKHQDHPETILLCDNCDLGWHLSCLRPPLLSVPEGDWICPTCEHSQLIEKLQGILIEYDEIKKKSENDEFRRQRLAFINVSMDNILPKKKKKTKEVGSDGVSDSEEDSETGSGSDDGTGSSDDSSSSDSDSSGPLYTLRARSSRNTKEQIENFDELINEAIRDEIEAAEAVKKSESVAMVVGRGKDIATIMEGEVEEDMNEDPMSGVELEDDEDEDLEVEEKVEKKVEEEEKVVPTTSPPKSTDDKVKNESKLTEESEKKPSSPDLNKKADSVSADEGEDDDKGVVEGERRPLPRRASAVASSSKKKRRLTDLEFEDEDHDSDEDFMGASEEDEASDEVEELSDVSFEIDSQESEDDSDYGGSRRRGGGRGKKGGTRVIAPLRRSTRSTRTSSYNDYDSDTGRGSKKGRKKRSRILNSSSSEEEELDEECNSSDSEIVIRKKKKRKPSMPKRGKKRGGKNASKKKKKASKKKSDNVDKPVKPRVRYAKPVKPPGEDDEEDDLQSSRRVTRGRKINYYDPIIMTEDEEEEELKLKPRGKVMKGERISDESGSEYELSGDDERRRRTGVRGSVGRGKVLKGEEDDEEEEDGGKDSDDQDYKDEDEERKFSDQGSSDDESEVEDQGTKNNIPTSNTKSPNIPTGTSKPPVPVSSVPDKGVSKAIQSNTVTVTSTSPSTTVPSPHVPPVSRPAVSIIPKPAGGSARASAGVPTPSPLQQQQQSRVASVLAAAGPRASLPPTLSITPVSAASTRSGGLSSSSVRHPTAPSPAQIRPATTGVSDKRVPSLPSQQQSSVVGRNSPDVGGWSTASPVSRYAPPPHTSVTSHSSNSNPYAPYGSPTGSERYPAHRPNFPPASFHPSGPPHIRGDPRHHTFPPPGHPAYASLMGPRFPPHAGVEAFRGRHPHPIPPQIYPGGGGPGGKDPPPTFRGLEPVPFSNVDASAPRHSPGTPSTAAPQSSMANRKELPPNVEGGPPGGGEFSSGLMSYFSSQRDENAD